jgi:hypothetical protein
MSSSVGIDATVFLTDDENTIREKIVKYSFSGGGGSGTLEDHRKYGGNPEVDIAYQYLRYFEDSDEKLQEIHDSFKKGDLTCGELKEILAKKIAKIVGEIRGNRAKVTQETLEDFYKLKGMPLPTPKPKEKTEQEDLLYQLLDKLEIQHITKYHGVISTAEEFNTLAMSVQGTICKTLFLKGPKDFHLYVINHKTILDTKTLHKKLELSKVRFGEGDTLTLMLKTPKNAGTMFSLFNDSKKEIACVFIEEGIPKDQLVNFYPMRPDATMTVTYSDMIKFIEHLGYPIKYIQQ